MNVFNMARPLHIQRKECKIRRTALGWGIRILKNRVKYDNVESKNLLCIKLIIWPNI